MKRFQPHRLALFASVAAVAVLCLWPGWAQAADLEVPNTVEAGQAFSISTEGSGQATFYLLGPDRVVKRTVSLGSPVEIQSSDVTAAGRYRVALCVSPCESVTFIVKAAQPEHLSFFLHPSRVPVSTPDSIDGTAFVFDQYFNLILTPATVDFRIAPAGGPEFSHEASTHHGVVWMRMNSTPHEGRVQVTAELGKVQEARVIQQVAAEACGLRMRAIPSADAVTLETDPVRDCSGNALPDGTVVSFTKIDRGGKSTVDTPIKKGVARVRLTVQGTAQISVACGVVLGNELVLNGKS